MLFYRFMAVIQTNEICFKKMLFRCQHHQSILDSKQNDDEKSIEL